MSIPPLALGQPAAAVAAPAPAQPSIATPDSDLAGFAKLLLKAIGDKNWALVVALVFAGLLALLRKYDIHIPKIGTKLDAWLNTRRGGTAFTLLSAVVGTFATALIAGAPFSWALLLNAVGLGIAAGGGWLAVRNVIFGDGADKAEYVDNLAKNEGAAAGAEAAKSPEAAAAALAADLQKVPPQS